MNNFSVQISCATLLVISAMRVAKLLLFHGVRFLMKRVIQQLFIALERLIVRIQIIRLVIKLKLTNYKFFFIKLILLYADDAMPA